MIRPYQDADREKLVEILRLNTPEYFDISEENDFLEYLENHATHYYVVVHQGEIAGAGGHNYLENGEARISWDLIHPGFQGNGFGSELTKYRIGEIKRNTETKFIVVRTSQLAHEFYAKFGFELVQQEKDYWAKGYDLYQMELMLE